jgi:hypothetical protein
MVKSGMAQLWKCHMSVLQSLSAFVIPRSPLLHHLFIFFETVSYVPHAGLELSIHLPQSP